MFEYITGKLTEATLSKIVIETHGIGYQIFIPVNNYGKLPAIGSEITCYITTVIREDSHKNYGFLGRPQRALFEKVIEISGIGPKIGLALIGHMEIEDFQFAIVQGNVAAICKIPGIGKKTAERLIIELRDKISKSPVVAPSEVPLSSDAISALVHLGYHAVQAQKAVQTALSRESSTVSLPELITAALRCICSNPSGETSCHP